MQLQLLFDDSCYVDAKQYHLASFSTRNSRLIPRFVNQSECKFLFSYAIQGITQEYQRKPHRPMTSSHGSTLTKCHSKNTGLLPSEMFKDPPIDNTIQQRQFLKDTLIRAKLSKRLLHVDRSCIGLSPSCYQCLFLPVPTLAPVPSQVFRFALASSSLAILFTPSCCSSIEKYKKMEGCEQSNKTPINITCALNKNSATEHFIIAYIP